MTARSNAIYATAIACLLAGCAQDGSLSTGLNTGSVESAGSHDAGLEITRSPVSHTRFADRSAEHRRYFRQGVEGRGEEIQAQGHRPDEGRRAQQGQHRVPDQMLELPAARCGCGSGHAGDDYRHAGEDSCGESQADGSAAEASGRRHGASRDDDAGVDDAGCRQRAREIALKRGLVLNFQAPAVSSRRGGA